MVKQVMYTKYIEIDLIYKHFSNVRFYFIFTVSRAIFYQFRCLNMNVNNCQLIKLTMIRGKSFFRFSIMLLYQEEKWLEIQWARTIINLKYLAKLKQTNDCKFVSERILTVKIEAIVQVVAKTGVHSPEYHKQQQNSRLNPHNKRGDRRICTK